MNNDIRFVHREETFNDFAVRELATGRAACICKLQFGRCTKTECKNCNVFKRYKNCYKQFSDYDRERFAKYVSSEYIRFSRNPDQWRSWNGYVTSVGIKAILFIPFFIGIGLFFDAVIR